MAEFMQSAEDSRPEHLYDTIDPLGMQEDDDDLEGLEPKDESVLPGEAREGRCPEQLKFKQIDVLADDEMLKMARNLSSEQMVVLARIVNYLKKVMLFSDSLEELPRLMVHGGGGVGKSYLIRTVAQWAEKILRRAGDNPLKPKVLLLAPTGMAASLIGGTTLQSGLSLKFGTKYLSLRDTKREELRILFEELQLIIIDECSMVSADALYDVHRRLQEIFVSKDFFGGKSILLVGDLMQLPPVKGRPIFAKPKCEKNVSLWSSNENLWSSFEVITLNTNFRQGISEWTKCLNRLRIGEITDDDRTMLEQRRLTNFPDLNKSKATHVYYTNENVDTYNMEMMDSMEGEFVTLNAQIVVPRGYKTYVTPHGTVEDTQFRKTLMLKKGVRVMLTFNVRISDSLINGALGTVIGFLSGKEAKVVAVVVKFDNDTVGKMQREDYKDMCEGFINQNGCPIFRSTLKFQGTAFGSLNSHGAKCKITQFPLRLAFASTTHKLQGANIGVGSDMIAHGHINRKKKNQIAKVPKCLYYVMLSRCSSIENVYLDEHFDIDQIQCSIQALKEANVLDEKSLFNKVKNEVFEIFYINIRSWSKHEVDLWHDLAAKQSSFICLVETWIEPSTPSPMTISGKFMYHSSFGRGRGSAIITKEEESQVFSVCTEYFQLISLPLPKFQLTTIYLSKEADLHDVRRALIQTMDNNMPQMIMGDFNFVRVPNSLTDLFCTQGLVPIVTEPTHVDGRTLDQIFVSNEIKDKIELFVQFKYYSDHSAFQVKIKD